ncbi:MAG: integrase family protein [Deltaproteobacteria bacterium]|jgi:integrase|nr:integrase family protein [Deltaproteobacteria bacterium]
MEKTKNQNKITKSLIDKLELPKKGQVFVWDDKLKGFGIRLTPGNISYFIQGRVNGLSRRITIGKHGVFTPQEARNEAKEKLRDLAKGTDPVIQKKLKKAHVITLKDAAEKYKQNKRTKKGHLLKESTKNDIDKHIRTTFLKWKDLPIVSITEDMVHDLYVESCERSIAQTNQAFRIFRAIFNYTRDKSKTKENFPENPVNTLKGEWGHVPVRNGKIIAEKFGMAWNYLDHLRTWPGQTVASRTGADLVLFLLVTGARFTEAASLPWENVNIKEGFWELVDPKNRKPITFPLSSVAIEILEDRPIEGEYVFPGIGEKGYFGDLRNTMGKLSEKIGENLIPSDLRRSFLLAAGEAKVEFIRCKLLMGHTLSGDVTINNYMETSDLRWLSDDSETISQWMIRQGKLEKNKIVDINTAREA